MNKKIIIVIIVLIGVVSISGCITSSMGTINNSISDLNSRIQSGDSNFNDAVTLVNNKNYNTALSKLNTSKTSFADGQQILLKLNNETNQINDGDYINYIQLTTQELNYKENATDYLIYAVNAYQKGDNNSGNDYVQKANYAMNEGVNYQSQRDYIVKNNPDKFKNSTMLSI